MIFFSPPFEAAAGKLFHRSKRRPDVEPINRTMPHSSPGSPGLFGGAKTIQKKCTNKTQPTFVVEPDWKKVYSLSDASRFVVARAG